MRPLLLAPLLALAVAAGCAAPPELEGAAAARSRGADVPGTEESQSPARAPAPAAGKYDPWLDDARELARVNGKVITLRQARHLMEPLYSQNLDRREDLARLVHSTVKRLVMQQLVVEEAKRIGITVSEDDLDRDERDREKAAARAGTTIDQHLRDMGMTRREWDDNRRDEIFYLKAEYILSGQAPDSIYSVERFRPSVDFYVSPEEVRAWGEAHPRDICRPETATVRVIDLRRDSFREGGGSDEDAWRRCGLAVDAVEARLRAGEPFAEVAKQVSQGPEAPGGGLLGPFEREGALRAEYREWAFAEGRREGEVSGRMRLPTGYVLLCLEKHEEARSATIEEWGPGARAHIEGLKKALAWGEVQVRLLEEASVSSPEDVPVRLRDTLLREARAEVRRLRQELPRVAPAGTNGRTVPAPGR